MGKDAWLVDPNDEDKRIRRLNLKVPEDRLVAREQWDTLDSDRLWELTPFRANSGDRLYLRKGQFAQSDQKVFFYRASPPGQISRSEANESGNTNSDLDFLGRLIEASPFAQLERPGTIKPKRLRRLPDLVFRLTPDCPLSQAEGVDFLSLEIRDHQTDKSGQVRHERFRAMKAYHVAVITKLKSGLSQAPSIVVSGKSAASYTLPNRFANNIRHLIRSKNAPAWALESKIDLATVIHRILEGHAVYTHLEMLSQGAKGWFWVDPQKEETDKFARFQQLRAEILQGESEVDIAIQKIEKAEAGCEKTVGEFEGLAQQNHVAEHFENWIIDKQVSWSQTPIITKPSKPLQRLLGDPLWSPTLLGRWRRFRRSSEDMARMKELHQQTRAYLEALGEKLDLVDSEARAKLRSARNYQAEIQEILERKQRESDLLLDRLPLA